MDVLIEMAVVSKQRRKKWGDTNHLPAITVLFVAGFANPHWLVEIAAITE